MWFLGMAKISTSSFVFQSSWMIVATCGGSAFMILVHTVARRMSDAEYSDFFMLLKVVTLLTVPGIALQMVFAQDCAAAVSGRKLRAAAAAFRTVSVCSIAFWGLLEIFVAVFLKPVSAWLRIAHPESLFLAILGGLLGCLSLLLKGILQGLHRFSNAGILQAIEGPIRFVAIIVVVLLLEGGSTGGMLAVVLGQALTVTVGIAMTSRFLNLFGERPDWAAWGKRGVPLVLGLTAINLMYSVDLFFVKAVFTDESKKALYQGATLTSYAVAQFLAPIAAVMFPRVVRDTARNGRSDTFFLSLAGTTLLGLSAATIFSFCPELPLRLIYMNSPEMWKASPLVPWLAWMTLPLLLGNVLLQHKLARRRYRVLPFVVIVPILYTAALCAQRNSLLYLSDFSAFRRIVQTLGCFGLIFLLGIVWIDRAEPSSSADGEQMAAEETTGS
jgi:O-antigen/teichoic acid export membrane protein